MILSCPACNARFLVPDHAIGAGRALRCGKCAHQWKVNARGEAQPTAPDIDRLMQEGSVRVHAAAPAGVKPKALPRGSNLPAVRPARISLRAAALSMLLIALCAYTGLLALMPEMMDIQSTSALTFSGVGIHHEAGASGSQRFSGTVERYTVEGNIVNTGVDTLPSPKVRVVLLDKNGTELKRWQVKHSKDILRTGETMPFMLPGIDLPKDETLTLRLDLGNWLQLALRGVQ